MSSFERLFGDGRDLEQAKGILALDAAAQTGDAAQVLELIRRGADVNQKSNEDGATPLHYAAERGHLDAARALLDHGAQVDVRAGPHETPHGLVGEGNTPLIFAAAEGHCEVIELLLDRGASIDMSNTVGSSTPLFLASQRGRTRVVEVLLRRGADPALKTDRGVLPLHIAAEHGYLEIVKLLLAHCPPGTEKLFEHRPAEINAVLYGHRTPADVPTFYGHDTPLHDAAQNGHEEIVALMLERGANPNSVDRVGNTPLHVAAHSGHAAVVRRLVAGGADPSIKNNAGYSAADLACRRPGADAALKDLIIATLGARTAKRPTDLGATSSAARQTSTAVEPQQKPSAARAPAPKPSTKAATRPTLHKRTVGDYVFRFFFFCFFGIPGLGLMAKSDGNGFYFVAGAALLAICVAGWVWTVALFVLHLKRKVGEFASDFAAGIKAFKTGRSDDT